MTIAGGEGTKIFTGEDYSENVPLWRALAEFTSEDIDEGLMANATVIGEVKARFWRLDKLAFTFSLIFGTLFSVCLIGLFIAEIGRAHV